MFFFLNLCKYLEFWDLPKKFVNFKGDPYCQATMKSHFHDFFHLCDIFIFFAKKSHLMFWILAFSNIFCPLEIDFTCNAVWPQASGFQKLANIFGIFHKPLSTQNVNIARFAAWLRLFGRFSNTMRLLETRNKTICFSASNKEWKIQWILWHLSNSERIFLGCNCRLIRDLGMVLVSNWCSNWYVIWCN